MSSAKLIAFEKYRKSAMAFLRLRGANSYTQQEISELGAGSPLHQKRGIHVKIKAMLMGLTAFACVAAQAGEKEVREGLFRNTGLTAETVRPTPVSGLWEVTVQGRLFYVDDKAHYVLTGSIIDTKTQENLTSARFREMAKENWSKWPFSDAVKHVYGNGKREVVVFSDANCTWCRRMEGTFEEVGNITVYTFIVPMLRGEQNNREIVCSHDPAKAWHDWMANGIRPAPASVACDSSVLARNAALMNKYNITGAPTLFFPSGARISGAVPAAQLEELLQEQ